MALENFSPRYNSVIHVSSIQWKMRIMFSNISWHGFLHSNKISPKEMFGEGNGNPLQYSCLENPMDGGAWWAAVHGVAKSQTQLSDFTFTFHFHALEKEMATHSSILHGESQGWEAWWAAVYGVTQSRTRWKWLSSSSSSSSSSKVQINYQH